MPTWGTKAFHCPPRALIQNLGYTSVRILVTPRLTSLLTMKGCPYFSKSRDADRHFGPSYPKKSQMFRSKVWYQETTICNLTVLSAKTGRSLFSRSSLADYCPHSGCEIFLGVLLQPVYSSQGKWRYSSHFASQDPQPVSKGS